MLKKLQNYYTENKGQGNLTKPNGKIEERIWDEFIKKNLGKNKNVAGKFNLLLYIIIIHTRF